MWWTASEADNSDGIATPVVLIVFIVGGIIYSFGYLRAVMHRANRDFKTTKAAVPTLRKGFWAAWWKAVKVGTFVVLAMGLLVVWMVHDVRKHDNADVKPAPSHTAPAKVKPSPSR